MKTIIYKIDEKNIDEKMIGKCAKALVSGKTVVFPTETVYGLGANALDESAVKKIFQAKNRPLDNPLIIHIGAVSDLENIVEKISEKSRKLIDVFWPGPLTIIFKKNSTLSEKVTCGLDTVAVRMPENKIALALLKKSGIPVAAPSANISGKPSGTEATHIIEDLYGKVDIIIDGGVSHIGIESTVIDMTADIPVILRPGMITIEKLIEVIGKVQYDIALEDHNKNFIAKSPGQKYRHYSPEGRIILFIGEKEKVISNIAEEYEKLKSSGKKVIILSTNETKEKYKCDTFSMGSREDLISISANLFRLFRKSDEVGADYILAEGINEKDAGFAIMNRLKKAAEEIKYCGD